MNQNDGNSSNGANVNENENPQGQGRMSMCMRSREIRQFQLDGKTFREVISKSIHQNSESESRVKTIVTRSIGEASIKIETNEKNGEIVDENIFSETLDEDGIKNFQVEWDAGEEQFMAETAQSPMAIEHEEGDDANKEESESKSSNENYEDGNENNDSEPEAPEPKQENNGWLSRLRKRF